MTNNERIKLFTDSDLDGVSCAILGKFIFKDNIDITLCTPKDVDNVITEFIKNNEFTKYNKVFITDLCIKETTGALIDSVNKYKFRLFDHHRSNYVNSKYDWAYIHESISGKKTCGTELLWNHFKDYYINWSDDSDYSVIDQYVEFVRLWDTWEWVDSGDAGIYAKNLNTIFGILQNKRFINNILERLIDNNYEYISDCEQEIIDIEENRKKRYINQKMKNVRIINNCKYKIGYVFAENYISELGNHIAKNIKDIDFAAIINADTSVVSLRAIKEANVNLGEIAKEFSPQGGGHPLSAGFVFENRRSGYMVEEIFGMHMCKLADD